MSYAIGMDIGGTKIAGALFDEGGAECKRLIVPTPTDYDAILATCLAMVSELDQVSIGQPTIGVGLPGIVDTVNGDISIIPNVAVLSGRNLRRDMEKIVNRPVQMANDASCAALSEAIDGAGAGYRYVFGVIMGTGVGGAMVVDSHIVEGANGVASEIGHLPLPYREASDGPLEPCNCGQIGCIDKTVSGPALARLWRFVKKTDMAVADIAENARKGDAEAIDFLNRFYRIVAKAMVTIIHTYDPHVIVVSGGLNTLPGLYEKVPEYLDDYAMKGHRQTLFRPAKHGAMSGLRGAAWLGRDAKTV